MAEKNQTKAGNSKGRGGARVGAGRKKSAVTTKTREIANKVIANAKEGGTPLEVIMRIMNGFLVEAETAANSDDADVRKTRVKLLILAKDAATAAAPYVHPRLAAIEHTGGDGAPLTPAVLVVPAGVDPEKWEAIAKT